MREIRCRDVGVDCDFVAKGNTDEEIMKQCRDHGQKEHGMKELPEELMKKMKQSIREV